MSQTEKEPKITQGVQDEIRQQQQKLKGRPFKEKLQYFWYYYKIHTIVILAVIFFGITLIHDITSAKDYIFYGVMLNAVQLSEEGMENAFSEYAGLDADTYECFIDTSSTLSYRTATQYDMATSQKLIALVQTKDLDAAVFDSEVYNNYANNGLFLDLSTVFTAEELQKYEDYLYYIDKAEVDRADEDTDYVNEDLLSSAESAMLSNDDVLKEAETHRHPENMEQPIPVGIFIEDSPFVQKSKAYDILKPVYGISATTTRLDTAKKYLEFLWDEQIDFASMQEEPLP
ncbi:MAG: hypothetical protein NC429_07805 [Lachnospiraceae bacterium]|nr:hypothetical protein [Lachnospiraceae bacterium]